MLKEFRAFVMRGNVLDLAIAVIIGAAFGKIVDSMVKDIIMPPLGLVLGRVDFSNLFVSLNGEAYTSLKAAQDAGAPTINYGLFVQEVVNFVILAFVIFQIVRIANRFQRPVAEEPARTKDCPYCLSSIAAQATRCPNCTSQLAA